MVVEAKLVFENFHSIERRLILITTAVFKILKVLIVKILTSSVVVVEILILMPRFLFQIIDIGLICVVGSSKSH